MVIEADTVGALNIPVIQKLHITGGLESGSLTVSDKISGSGGLTIDGNVFGDISIADITLGSVTLSASSSVEFAGTLDLLNGVLAGKSVTINSNVDTSSVIDLHDKAVAGTLECLAVNGGDITNGGALSGTVTLAGRASNAFSGTATFDSVAGTVKTVSGAAVSGTVNINGNLTGSVDVDDDLSGTVDVSLVLSGDVSVGGALSGSVEIHGDASGDLDITSNLSGSATVGGDLNADISIGGDLTSSGSVTVSGTLAGVGRIMTAITKECAGSISIGEQTDELTLIHCNHGLTSTGTIEINANRNNNDAEGTIRVGLATPPFPLPPITYDGCIRIYDKDPGGAGGDLEGTIAVIGCHADMGKLSMCIDGSVNGTIDIEQTGCTNQPGRNCPGCP